MKTIRIISQAADAEEQSFKISDATFEDMRSFVRNLDDGQFVPSANCRVFSSERKMQKFIDWITPRQAPADGSEPATERQLVYLATLHVRTEMGLSKGRASQLINAAKNDSLGSVNGFYEDGSN